MKLLLMIILLLGLVSCMSTKTYIVETKPVNKLQTERFLLAQNYSKAGDKKTANDIYLELANQGYMPALKLFAITRYNKGIYPVYRNNQNDKGCLRNNALMTKNSDTFSWHTYWAVEDMALQGDVGATYQYFNCQIKSWGYESPKNPKGALIAMDYLAMKGDIKAGALLIDYYLSYYEPIYSKPTIKEPFRRGKVNRNPDVLMAAKYAKSIAASTQINKNYMVNNAVQSIFKLAATEYSYSKNPELALKYYLLAQSVCQKFNITSSNECLKSSERIKALESIGVKI